MNGLPNQTLMAVFMRYLSGNSGFSSSMLSSSNGNVNGNLNLNSSSNTNTNVNTKPIRVTIISS